MSHTETVQNLWRLFSEQKWEEAKVLFHEDFEAHWPQSKERFQGADNYVGMNQEYPGTHVAEIRHLIQDGSTVACTAFVSADTGQTAFASSYFEFEDDRIIRATEYWAEEYPAPVARGKWTMEV